MLLGSFVPGKLQFEAAQLSSNLQFTSTFTASRAHFAIDAAALQFEDVGDVFLNPFPNHAPTSPFPPWTSTLPWETALITIKFTFTSPRVVWNCPGPSPSPPSSEPVSALITLTFVDALSRTSNALFWDGWSSHVAQNYLLKSCCT